MLIVALVPPALSQGCETQSKHLHLSLLVTLVEEHFQLDYQSVKPLYYHVDVHILKPAKGRCNITRNSGNTQGDKVKGSHICFFFQEACVIEDTTADTYIAFPMLPTSSLPSQRRLFRTKESFTLAGRPCRRSWLHVIQSHLLLRWSSCL